MKAKPFSFFLKTTQSLRSLLKYVNFKNLQHYINLLNKIFVRVLASFFKELIPKNLLKCIWHVLCSSKNIKLIKSYESVSTLFIPSNRTYSKL